MCTFCTFWWIDKYTPMYPVAPVRQRSGAFSERPTVFVPVVATARTRNAEVAVPHGLEVELVYPTPRTL